MTPRASLALASLTALASLSVLACGKLGAGHDLAEGRDCSTSADSSCASGLFCDTALNGREVREGAATYTLGKCTPPHSAGGSCRVDADCTPKNRCQAGATSAGGVCVAQ